MGHRPIYLFILHIYIYYYSDEIKPDPPTHTHNPSLGFLPARRVRKPSLISPLLPPATPAAPSSSPLMSSVPATGKRPRDADSDGEQLDDLPESGAYHPPTLHLPLAPSSSPRFLPPSSTILPMQPNSPSPLPTRRAQDCAQEAWSPVQEKTRDCRW